MCRRLRILAAVALIPLLSLVAVGPASAAHQGPPVRVPGLHAAAWITRDVEGIAHIRAGDQRDLFFLQGWVHAADRLFQMDVTRRQASGTLAELLGQPALAGDVQARTIGLRRAAERGLPVQSPEGRQALDAYAAGVNAWVASHRLPAQYAAIQITKFQPWTPVDSLVIGKAISLNLSFDLDLDLTTTALAYQAAGAAAGFNGAALFSEDLYRSEPFSNASTVPDATGTPARATGVTGAPPASGTVAAGSDVPPAAARLAEAYRALAGRTPLLANAVHRTFAMGSNEWAIAGRYTATGKPILANDPHLALTSPRRSTRSPSRPATSTCRARASLARRT
jgi:penicillin amidase